MTGYQMLILLILIVFAATALFLFLPATSSQKRNDSTPNDAGSSVMERDEARHWLGGLIYYNSGDLNAFVPKRFGMGRTVNFGHLTGKLFMIALQNLAFCPLCWQLLASISPHKGAARPGETACHKPGVAKRAAPGGIVWEGLRRIPWRHMRMAPTRSAREWSG